MNVHVFAMSYDTARPPSLPISTWFGFAGLIQIACTSSCVDAATSVAIVLPPSSVRCRPTPPR